MLNPPPNNGAELSIAAAVPRNELTEPERFRRRQQRGLSAMGRSGPACSTRWWKLIGRAADRQPVLAHRGITACRPSGDAARAGCTSTVPLLTIPSTGACWWRVSTAALPC